jgi:hypothetical protein
LSSPAFTVKIPMFGIRTAARRLRRRLTNYRTLSPAMRAVDTIEGMISIPEAQLLYDLARLVNPHHCIVEVGSYRGRSTVALSLGAQDGGNGVVVYAVEPHQTFSGILGGKFSPEDRSAFYHTMLRTGCWNNVALVNLSSERVTPGFGAQVHLLFIDRDHSEAGVRRDWECWRPFLVASAKVAFDDATDPRLGPHKLLTQLLSSGEWRQAAAVGKVRVIENGR